MRYRSLEALLRNTLNKHPLFHSYTTRKRSLISRNNTKQYLIGRICLPLIEIMFTLSSLGFLKS